MFVLTSFGAALTTAKSRITRTEVWIDHMFHPARQVEQSEFGITPEEFISNGWISSKKWGQAGAIIQIPGAYVGGSKRVY